MDCDFIRSGWVPYFNGQDLKCPDDTDDDNKLSEKIKAALDEGKDITVGVLESMKIEKVVEMSEK